MIVDDYRALVSGYDWPKTGDPDRVVVTYALPSERPGYLFSEGDDPRAFYESFTPASGAAGETARSAMRIWESVANIQLVEVRDTEAEIQMGLYDFGLIGGDTVGYAYYPGDYFQISGDVFISRDYSTNLDLWLHEIGHALGLKHPHEGSPTLDAGMDTTTASVMSYQGYDIGGLGHLDADALSAIYPGAIARDTVVSEFEIRSRPADMAFAQLRDFDGNDLGADGDWRLVASLDIDGDGSGNLIAVNDRIARWASLSVDEFGFVDFSDHGQGGGTRVVGTYVDPLVASGAVAAGSDHDSQKRLSHDLGIGNIASVLDAGDYDGDGVQEAYFGIADGSAVLHAYLHADGNIRYANYQTVAQAAEFLEAAGAGDYGDWLYA